MGSHQSKSYDFPQTDGRTSHLASHSLREAPKGKKRIFGHRRNLAKGQIRAGPRSGYGCVVEEKKVDRPVENLEIWEWVCLLMTKRGKRIVNGQVQLAGTTTGHVMSHLVRQSSFPCRNGVQDLMNSSHWDNASSDRCFSGPDDG